MNMNSAIYPCPILPNSPITFVLPCLLNESADTQARELANALDEMRKSAMALPGGNYSVENIQRMSAVLEAEAEKRRYVLLPFHSDCLNRSRTS